MLPAASPPPSDEERLLHWQLHVLRLEFEQRVAPIIQRLVEIQQTKPRAYLISKEDFEQMQNHIVH